jgi:hypothetical protein
MPVPEAPALKPSMDFQIRVAPADGTRAAKWRKRRLRYVTVFGQPQSSSACHCLRIWGTGTKAQWRGEKLIRG